MFMKKYQKKPVAIEAIQWFKNGDHPRDECPLCHDEEGKPFLGEGKVVRRYRNAMIPGEAMCAQCRQTHHVHGWLDVGADGQKVCPGDFVCTDDKGKTFAVRPESFAATYEPLEQ